MLLGNHRYGRRIDLGHIGHICCPLEFITALHLYLEHPFPLSVATNSPIINRERIVNMMTFVSTKLRTTHRLYINVYILSYLPK